MEKYGALVEIMEDLCAKYENVQLIRADAAHSKLLMFAPRLEATDNGRA